MYRFRVDKKIQKNRPPRNHAMAPPYTQNVPGSGIEGLFGSWLTPSARLTLPWSASIGPGTPVEGRTTPK